MPIATEPFLPKKETYVPTDPDLFRIQFAEGDFNSCLKAHKVSPSSSLRLALLCINPVHCTVAYLLTARPASAAWWASV